MSTHYYPATNHASYYPATLGATLPKAGLNETCDTIEPYLFHKIYGN